MVRTNDEWVRPVPASLKAAGPVEQDRLERQAGLAWPRLTGYPAAMPEFTEKQVEAEARRILRAKIKAMPWHPGLPPEKRKRMIEADVDRWWHLEVREATRRLLDRRG